MPVNPKKVADYRDFSSLVYAEIKKVQEKHNISDNEAYQLISNKSFGKHKIPICVFGYNTLSSFQAIVKFLRENCRMNFREIGVLLNRSKFTIASSYRSAKTQSPVKYILYSSKYDIPTKLIASRRYSVLESIVLFLKQRHNLRFSEISVLLHLDQRTIWTVYQRALKK